MNEQTKTPVPVWFWVIAVLALLWNLMGCAAFLMEVFLQEAIMEEWPQEQKDWASSIPGWIYYVYGLAVFSGAVGSIGLLMRKAWSIPLYAICLAAVIVQMVYTMVIAGGLEVMGPTGAVMPLMVIVFACVLLWFSWFSKAKGWLV